VRRKNRHFAPKLPACAPTRPKSPHCAATLAGFSPNPPGGELLEKISATMPPEIALATLHVGAWRFTLHGHVAPSAPAGALDGWRTKFADSRWTLEIPATPALGGAFTIEGKFTS